MKPLCYYQREGVTEVTFYGSVFWVHGKEVIHHFGENDLIYGRSVIKPYQIKVFEEELSQLNTKQKALSVSSHSGEERHIEVAKSFLDKKDWSFLKTPHSKPMDKSREVCDSWHHPCSGKHMAILKGCQSKGWGLENYLSQDHNYHKAFMEVLKKVLGDSWTPKKIAKDGCTLPAPTFFIHELAMLFSHLNSKEGWIWEAMTSEPYFVGGTNRLDTDIMLANDKKVLAKEGADGLLGLSIEHKDYPKGLGVIIKLNQGGQPLAMRWVANEILKSLNLKSVSAASPEGQTVFVEEALANKNKNTFWDITPLVSSDMAVFPGDTPFSRNEKQSYKEGAGYTLSSIETTVHIGAHADAPNHYSSSVQGIDQVCLKNYFGKCQVISVNKKAGERIFPEDFSCDIEAPRVLFKTLSFENQNQWKEDFNSLSPELVEFLSEKSVKLVGIDTPSVDPNDSKELESHHKIKDKNISILEGLVLTDVSDGIYQLTALPLKLKDCDASPVRAILTK